MRFIEGTDLDTLLKRFGPLTPPRAAPERFSDAEVTYRADIRVGLCAARVLDRLPAISG